MKFKKFAHKALALVLATVVATSAAACGKQADTQSEAGKTVDAAATAWKENALQMPQEGDHFRTYYEVFVYSYCDSDGDGIGDINGLRSKLDYIQDMGYTGIWLMPVMPSPSYHKYDTTDYLNIDSAYGTLDDFKAFLADCHERNIEVIIDFVMNHSSSEHPWFKEAYKYMQSLGKDEEPDASKCPYVDYYNFTKSQEGGYSEVSGTDWYYEAQFWYGMPDLNWDSEAVKNEFKDIAKFWLDLGVDGFRLDAVIYFYFGNHEKSIEVLKWFNDYVKSVKPSAYIVCEGWTDQNTYAKYYDSGVDSMFDFAFADQGGVIAKVLKGTAPAGSYGAMSEKAQELYASHNENAIDAPFYTNHDMARSAGFYPGDLGEARVKMAQALNLLMTGNVFVYYGEELGMKGSGKDENKRAPMYWSKDANAQGMCKGPQGMDSFEMKFDSYEEQSKADDSIYNYVKSAILLRNQNEIIRKGKVQNLSDLSTDYVDVIKKTYNDEEIVILLNVAEEAQTVDATSLNINGKTVENAEVAGELLTGDETVTIEKNTITLPAFSILVLK